MGKIDDKVKAYELAMEKFINILINVKVQIAINPKRAQENIDEVINLLRKQKLDFSMAMRREKKIKTFSKKVLSKTKQELKQEEKEEKEQESLVKVSGAKREKSSVEELKE